MGEITAFTPNEIPQLKVSCFFSVVSNLGMKCLYVTITRFHIARLGLA